jgi:HipA-like protein
MSQRTPMKKAANKKRPTVLEVWLNQVRVGTITNLPNDRNLFVFDEEYAQMVDRPVLSMSFYDEERNLITDPEQVQTNVPPFFSNLLPEATAGIRCRVGWHKTSSGVFSVVVTGSRSPWRGYRARCGRQAPAATRGTKNRDAQRNLASDTAIFACRCSVEVLRRR